MACQNCPEDKTPLQGVVYICYGGGPPSAPFSAVGRAIPRRTEEVITLYGTSTVDPIGNIHYDKNGAEPPVPIGYARVPGDNWTLRPVWRSCMFRLLRVQPFEDGSLQIIGLCAHPASGYKAQEAIDPQWCEGCAIRAPIR